MTIDRDTLERLVIDRSLDALHADTEALLAAYLAADPEAAAAARGFDEAARLARAALRHQPAGPLPPFPGPQIARAARTRRWRGRAGYVGALAASLLVGLALGHGMERPEIGGAMSRGAPASAQPAPGALASEPVAADRLHAPDRRNPIMPVAEASSPTSDFWSLRRWYERAAARQSQERGRFLWHSPVHWPGLRGES